MVIPILKRNSPQPDPKLDYRGGGGLAPRPAGGVTGSSGWLPEKFEQRGSYA